MIKEFIRDSGDLIGDLADDYVEEYFNQQCKKTDSIIVKGVCGTVSLLASTVGIVGYGLSALSDVFGENG